MFANEHDTVKMLATITFCGTKTKSEANTAKILAYTAKMLANKHDIVEHSYNFSKNG